MGLYLCIYEGEEDIEGIDVGQYADFGNFRDYVAASIEGGDEGSCFPVLMLHSDCDGEWSVADCPRLREELTVLRAEMMAASPEPFQSEWQAQLARRTGLVPENALESFLDVDGELLVDRLIDLTAFAIDRGLPISFQ